jgi:hypothetical protein
LGQVHQWAMMKRELAIILACYGFVDERLVKPYAPGLIYATPLVGISIPTRRPLKWVACY